MSELRFDGRTAIVTGAGGDPSLGRAFALLLASRGAQVVVNDVGEVPEMPGYETPASAEAVAAEIRALGGEAVADAHSVATEAGAAGLIDTALQAFGRVDVLINNAAICNLAPFDVISSRDYDNHIQINVMGPVWTSRAAWPHMCRQRYGRIVNIGSSAFLGIAGMSPYGVSKGGLFSLSRSLAAEGAPYGIKANTVGATGFTRMVPTQQYETSTLYQDLKANYPPELAAPLVVYMAHESCPVNGEAFDTAGGRVNRTYVSKTRGFTDREQTMESLAARFGELMATEGSRIVAAAERDSLHDSANWNIKPYPSSILGEGLPNMPPEGEAQ
jgi:NAD(P)-dependent dehydrogenase (short-subunit alcohol dehydrogenase family)